jgi:very-short-patch-repair endonuclease
VHDGPFRGSTALADRIITPAVLRGPRYRRLFPDIYAATDLEPDLALRSRAAHLWLGGAGVLGGYSAAEIYAARCAPQDAAVEIVVPGKHLRGPPGVTVRRDLLATDERRRYRDLDVTTPIRTAYDLARRDSLTEAVVSLDALAGRFGFAPAEVLELSARYPRARGRRQLAGVVQHAEPLSESAMESRLRMLLVLEGLPRPKAQHGVTDHSGRVVAYVDLSYPDRRIAIEYEGEEHFDRERAKRDTRRGTRLVDLGWAVFRYLAADVYSTPERTVREVREALRTRRVVQ